MDAAALLDFMPLWDFNDLPATEEKFLALMPQAVASGDLSYQAQLLTQIGRTYGLRRNYAEAYARFDAADALVAEGEAQGDDMTKARLRGLLERGRTLNWDNGKEQAEQLFRQAYELARRSGYEALAIDAAHMIAIAGDLPTQIEWGLKGLAEARGASDPKAQNWEGPLLNNLGWSYFYSGRLDDALTTFNESWEWRKQQGPPFAEYVAKWTVARCLRALGRVDEALALQQDMLAHNLTNDSADGYVFEELGECLLAQGKPEEARQYFAKAYELLSAASNLNDNDKSRLPRMKELGGL